MSDLTKFLMSRFDHFLFLDKSHKIGGDTDWVFRAFISHLSFKHTGIIVCLYEGGGMSDNAELQKESAHRRRMTYFNKFERSYFGSCYFIWLLVYRIKTLNFRIPVRVKELLRKKYNVLYIH